MSFDMDPERQPLLRPQRQDVRCSNYRPLTSEEVHNSRQEATWRRVHFFIVIMFWAIMAMFLSSIASILIQAPKCPTVMPSVSPVHLNFAPLVTGQAMDAGRELDDHGKAYDLWML